MNLNIQNRMFNSDIREVKDGDQPAPCINDYSLPMTCMNHSTTPTFIWEPAHPSPKTIDIAAKYPAIFMQLEGKAAFTLI
jgi:hypothetical protein